MGIRGIVGAITLAVCLHASGAWGAQLRVIGFNVESDADTQVAKVAEDVQKIANGVHLFGLTEVEGPQAAEAFARAASAGNGGREFKTMVGATGGKDRVAILYNATRLEPSRRGFFEIHTGIARFCASEGGNSNFRGTLVGEFRDKESRQAFWFMVNHLQRGNEKLRHCQARFLNEFMGRMTIPTIAVGDYNFDFDLHRSNNQPTGKQDEGLGLLTAGNRFVWVRPAQLVATQCDDKFYSVLDFVFVANRAKGWAGKSVILFPEPSYCPRDKQGYADHRPIAAQFLPR